MEKQKATMKILSFLMFYINLVASQSPVADNRCFLESGSSSESFFVPEDQPVGSTIGQVRIVGDPRPGGNIGLRLKEADSPVAIAPGTKNLTLKKRLDKEGLEGPSSVFVNLICDRLNTPDPGFAIPINIRVTDANDNSPVFINAPYTLNISEVTVVGTRVLQGVHAVDNDQQGPFSNVRYSISAGPDYFEFENELEGTLVLKKPLDYESLKTFDVHIRAQDHGEPPRTADTVLTVYVMDADDQNPRFLDDRYTASVRGADVSGTVLTVQPKDIRAVDQDKGLNAPVYYTFNGLGPDYELFKINRKTGKVALARNITDGSLRHPATIVIRATQEDNPDRYALATLTVNREGGVSDGIQFLHEVFFISVVESTPTGTVIATLANNRPGQSLKYYVSDQNILKTFALNTKGELSLKKMLDFEERPEYSFKVFATDGITNDSSLVNITVEDVNEWEPRFRYPHYEFYATGEPKELLGKIEAADGDKNDKITLTLLGVNASSFFITPMGELRLRGDGGRNTGSVSFEVVATDNGRPPKSSKVPVSVHFPGGENLAAVGTKRSGAGTSLLLVGLGTSLTLLAVLVAFLVAYIYRSKRNNRRELPTLQQEKTSCSSPISAKMSNPVFNDRLRNPTATAMGGLPNLATQLSKSTIPSPKVHPAPPPPVWPHSATSSVRVKKLSWGDDKTDSGSSENLDNIDVTPKVMESTNLTVYF
ncbi:protocadherin-16 [Harmonia axyridis]|uniref:protocadherin-16 n=1 Tax=Harmonia axyridis TaxID=115357 RepID=UPI001E279857|nr:protocadherin-16 [Harmonia axyridis]